MPRRQLLSESQRAELLALPSDEGEFIRHYTLLSNDLTRIARFNKAHNRLGFAVLLCYLRYPGQELLPRSEPDQRLIHLVSKQLGVDPEIWPDYIRRDETRREHMVTLASIYGFRTFSAAHYRTLSNWLFPLALQTDQGMTLAVAILEELRALKIIVPPLAVIERLCAETATRALRHLYRVLSDPLSELQKERIDRLLEQHEKRPSITTLTWLRQPPGAPNAKHVLELIKRLRIIHDLNLPPGLERSIHRNRLLKLARVAGQTTVQHLRRFDDAQRYALLIVLLLETRATLTDEVLAMHDKIMGVIFSKAKRKHQVAFAASAKEINEKIRLYARIGQALVTAKREGRDLNAAIEAVVSWDTFETTVTEAERMVPTSGDDSLGLIGSSYSRIRRYAPALLDNFDFRAAPVADDLLSAIKLLRQLNETKTRTLQKNAPTSFVRQRWQPFVNTVEGIDRRYYELCVLSEMKNSLRSGDLWVIGSRQFKDFEDYLLPPDAFGKLKASSLPLPVEPDGKAYLAGRVEELRSELSRVNDLVSKDGLPDVSITKGRLKIKPLANAVPDEAAANMRRVYNLMPHLRITELLMEVDEWTGFTRHFTHMKSGDPCGDRELLLTALLADGINMGLTKMAEVCPEATYSKLSWLSAWHIRDETYSLALASLVNAQHQHFMSGYWGEGTTSSSDGQRFRAGGRGKPAARVNLKYGTDPSVMVYTHISDRYAPFHSQVINANVRDATHVLDGLLYHESDIKIKEHYTDTAGFTDHVFGLCHLLGFKFAPRIRNLKNTKLYVPGKIDNCYSALDGQIGGTINQKHLLSHWEEILRLATSIRQGTVTASLMLRKLGSYPRQNGLALALREVGRFERTLFILQWLQDPALRRRVQIGLNKGEARNALARAVFFNRIGEMRDRSFEYQNYRASGLNLVVSAIILWNTVYIERVLTALKNHGNPVPEELIPHLSPLGWEHINLTGDYVWKHAKKVTRGNFRPLRKVVHG